MKNLKSLSEFSKENQNLLLENSMSSNVLGGYCPTIETDVTASDNNDTCTTTWDDKGRMLSHEHK